MACLTGAAATGTVEVVTLEAGTVRTGVVAPHPHPMPAQGDGMVLYLPFEADTGGTVKDASGNGHDGTAVNCAWTLSESAGRLGGGAMSFRDPDGFIVFPGVPDFPSWETYSVSVWFMDNGGSAASYSVIMDKAPPEDYGWTLYLDYGAVRWIMRDAWNNCFLSTTWSWYPVYSDGQWHHVAAVRDGTNAQLWVDGELMDSRDDAIPIYNNQPLYVGNSSRVMNYYNGNSYHYSYDNWGGLLDEVRVYGRALSGTEIGLLYSGGRQPDAVAVAGGLTVNGDLSVTRVVNFSGSPPRLKLSGNLSSGIYTNAP